MRVRVPFAYEVSGIENGRDESCCWDFRDEVEVEIREVTACDAPPAMRFFEADPHADSGTDNGADNGTADQRMARLLRWHAGRLWVVRRDGGLAQHPNVFLTALGSGTTDDLPLGRDRLWSADGRPLPIAAPAFDDDGVLCVGDLRIRHEAATDHDERRQDIIDAASDYLIVDGRAVFEVHPEPYYTLNCDRLAYLGVDTHRGAFDPKIHFRADRSSEANERLRNMAAVRGVPMAARGGVIEVLLAEAVRLPQPTSLLSPSQQAVLLSYKSGVHADKADVQSGVGLLTRSDLELFLKSLDQSDPLLGFALRHAAGPAPEVAARFEGWARVLSAFAEHARSSERILALAEADRDFMAGRLPVSGGHVSSDVLSRQEKGDR